MSISPTVLVAGAGIGGLTAALTLADAGIRTVVLEAASELSALGAGIQLSPNATRIMAALGLAEALRPQVVAPQSLHIMQGRSGREIASIALGEAVAARCGAPYWALHRADLQRVLLAAIAAQPKITLRTGVTVLGHSADAGGVLVAGRTRSGIMVEEQADALIGADGLWSATRARLGHEALPRFRHRTAWRALLDATDAEPAWRAPAVRLWLGAGAHLVHYPVRGGRAINIVAIVADGMAARTWANAGERDALLAKFARWSPQARAVIAAPNAWQTWSLHDLPPATRPGKGPVTLLGDAAHPMMPFLAQGAAMAIEDAAALAHCLESQPDSPIGAFRAYERMRAGRTMRTVRESARMGAIYHLAPPWAWARDRILGRMPGAWLDARQDWLYRWPA